MILVDTSVWVDHFREGDASLAALLADGRVMTHPFVIGEIALGAIPKREAIIGDLGALPSAETVSFGEIVHFIERQALFGLGIGYVDAHLLASTFLTKGAALWSRDKRLAAAAERLGVATDPSAG